MLLFPGQTVKETDASAVPHLGRANRSAAVMTEIMKFLLTRADFKALVADFTLELRRGTKATGKKLADWGEEEAGETATRGVDGRQTAYGLQYAGAEAQLLEIHVGV